MSRTVSPVLTQNILDYGDVDGDIARVVERQRPGAKPAARPGRKRIAFGWYGGKYSHLDWLLPLLPQTRQYCEPFGGSAAVLLNREPAEVETYNDLDGEVVNFFRVLRERKDDLVEAIGLTPFSRAEFALAYEPANESEKERQSVILVKRWKIGLVAAIYQLSPNRKRSHLCDCHTVHGPAILRRYSPRPAISSSSLRHL